MGGTRPIAGPLPGPAIASTKRGRRHAQTAVAHVVARSPPAPLSSQLVGRDTRPTAGPLPGPDIVSTKRCRRHAQGVAVCVGELLEELSYCLRTALRGYFNCEAASAAFDSSSFLGSNALYQLVPKGAQRSCCTVRQHRQ